MYQFVMHDGGEALRDICKSFFGIFIPADDCGIRLGLKSLLGYF